MGLVIRIKITSNHLATIKINSIKYFTDDLQSNQILKIIQLISILNKLLLIYQSPRRLKTSLILIQRFYHTNSIFYHKIDSRLAQYLLSLSDQQIISLYLSIDLDFFHKYILQKIQASMKQDSQKKEPKKLEYIKQFKSTYGKNILLYEQPNASVIALTQEEANQYYNDKDQQLSFAKKPEIGYNVSYKKNQPINLTKQQIKIQQQISNQNLKASYITQSSTIVGSQIAFQCEDCIKKQVKIRQYKKLITDKDIKIKSLKKQNEELQQGLKQAIVRFNQVSAELWRIKKQKQQTTKQPKQNLQQSHSSSSILIDFQNDQRNSTDSILNVFQKL